MPIVRNKTKKLYSISKLHPSNFRTQNSGDFYHVEEEKLSHIAQEIYPNLNFLYVKGNVAEGKRIVIIIDRMAKDDIQSNCVLAKDTVTVLDNMLTYCQEAGQENFEFESMLIINFQLAYFGDKRELDSNKHFFFDRMWKIIEEYGASYLVFSGIPLFNYVVQKVKNSSKTYNQYFGRLFNLKYNNLTYKVMMVPPIHLLATTNQEEAKTYPLLIGFWCKNLLTVLRGYNAYTLNFEGAKIKYIDSIGKFNQFYKELIKQKIVCIDTETKNLNRMANTLFSIQFAFSGKEAYFLPIFHPKTPFNKRETAYICKKLKYYFEFGESDYHIYHNAKFDLTVLMIPETSLGVRFHNHKVFDTISGMFTLDENRKNLVKLGVEKPYSLASLTYFYGSNIYDKIGFKKADRGNMDATELNKGLIEYGCYDVLIPYQLHEFMLDEAKTRGYTKYKKLIINQMGAMLKAFTYAEHNGMLIDKKYLFSLLAKNSSINKAIVEHLNSLRNFSSVRKANNILLKKHNIPSSSGLFNINTWLFKIDTEEHKQILFKDILKLAPVSFRKAKKGEAPDTYYKIDKKFQEKHAGVPEVKTYFLYKKFKSLRDSFVGNSNKGIYKIVSKNPDTKFDGRVRPRFSSEDVVTGRSSSKDPNLQNIPEHGVLASLIKRMWVASKGCLIFEEDYCLTGDTLIPTKGGLCRIDSIVEHNNKVDVKVKQDIDILVNNGDREARAIKWMYNGHKEVFEVKTKSSNSIKCTANHKLLVLRKGRLKWVKAADCRVDSDFLCLSTNPTIKQDKLQLNLSDAIKTNSNSTTGHTCVFLDKRNNKYFVKIKNNYKYDYLGQFKNIDDAIAKRNEYWHNKGISTNRSFFNIKKPKIMTPALAKVIALIISEGNFTTHLKHNYVFFSNSNKKLLNVYITDIKNLFGWDNLKYRIKSHKGKEFIINGVHSKATKNHYVVRIRSNQLVIWLQELGLVSKPKLKYKKTPSYYKRIPWSIMQADKRSQYAFLSAYLEGDGYISNNNLHWSSTSKKFINDLRILLNNLGFISTTLINKHKVLTLKLGKVPSQNLWAKIKKYKVSKTLTPYDSFEILGKIPYKYKKIWFISESGEKNYERLIKRGYHFSPISSIKYAGIEPVYDLTMEKSSAPRFVANGIIVHNCAHEVRSWGNISGDDNILNPFKIGMFALIKYRLNPTVENKKVVIEKSDNHRVNFIFFFGRPPKDKDERNEVKALVFGVIYGKTPDSLGSDFYEKNPTKYGTLEAAQEIAWNLTNLMFKKFKAGKRFLDKSVAFAKKFFYCMSPIGRPRHLWGFMHFKQSFQNAMARRGPNSQIQGISSDILVYAADQLAGMIWHYFIKYDIDFPICMINYVHDSIKSDIQVHLIPILYYLKEHASTTKVHSHYRRLFGFKMKVGLQVDFGIGAHLDSIKKWDYNELSTDVRFKDGDKEEYYPNLHEIVKKQVYIAQELYPDYWTETMIEKTMAVFDHNLAIIHKLRQKELKHDYDNKIACSEYMIMNEKNARSFGLKFSVED